MKQIKQFSVWDIELEKEPIGHEQGGQRPFFVLSSTNYNQRSGTPIGFIVSSSKCKSKNEFVIKIELKNKQDSHINISQIRTLDKIRFKKYKEQISNKYAIESISKFISKIIFDDKFDDSKFLDVLNKCNMEMKIDELKNTFNKNKGDR